MPEQQQQQNYFEEKEGKQSWRNIWDWVQNNGDNINNKIEGTTTLLVSDQQGKNEVKNCLKEFFIKEVSLRH